MFEEEWFWAVLILAIPLVAFGGFELTGFLRRGKLDAQARRNKAMPPQSPERKSRRRV